MLEEVAVVILLLQLDQVVEVVVDTQVMAQMVQF
jgi:hypothetical protein